MTAWLITDLPEPDSPTSAVTLPGRMRRLARLHGLDPAAEQREGDAQILDPQQVCTLKPCPASPSPGRAFAHARPSLLRATLAHEVCACLVQCKPLLMTVRRQDYAGMTSYCSIFFSAASRSGLRCVAMQQHDVLGVGKPVIGRLERALLLAASHASKGRAKAR